jgi:dsRNA-specific ribonuclease
MFAIAGGLVGYHLCLDLDKMATKINEYLNWAEDIVGDLGLNEAPFSDLNLYFILNVFTWRSAIPVPRVVSDAIRQSGAASPDTLEFIGDAVLHIVFTPIVVGKGLNVDQMTKYRSELERNTRLAEFATYSGMCLSLKPAKSAAKKDIKPCADIFEALVGTLFVHLFYDKKMGYASIDYISDWIERYQPNELIDDLIARRIY